jgi:Bacterial PH domain
VLTAPPPVRSLAISAGAAVIAAGTIVLGSALDLPRAVPIAGVGLMIFAVVLAVVALALTARLRTTLVLDSESITIINGRRRRVVPWSTIDIVRMQGRRLLLITKPEGGGSDVTVFNARAETDATFSALIAEIQKRLNADRGYRQIS